MAEQTHIIKKVQAELSLSSKEGHREKSEHLRQVLQQALDALQPALDQHMGDGFCMIDSLYIELNLTHTNFDSIHEDLVRKISDKIVRSIEASGNKSGDSSSSKSESRQMSPEERHELILRSFLTSGSLPWWADSGDFKELEQWASELSVQKWINILEPLLRSQPAVSERFTAQFRPSLVNSVIEGFTSKTRRYDSLLPLYEEIQELGRSSGIALPVLSQLKNVLQSNIITGIIGKLDQDELNMRLLSASLNVLQPLDEALNEGHTSSLTVKLEDRLHQITSGKAITEQQYLEEEKSNENKEPARDEQSVLHAGAVILHPFLKHLFENLGFVEGGQFVHEAARERAVCLLYHVVTGDNEFPEYALSIPKYLCGWPMEQPVNRFMKLSSSEQEEGEHMLKSCIEHWEALKNTSPEGLRNNFLQREGILKHEEFGWSLYIEEQTIDVLLDKLPWNLSIIKLPWMDEMLTVHWQ